MSQDRRCPQCGGELPANAPQGLCPACLLERGLESQRPAEGSAAAPQGSAGFTPPLIEDLAPYFPNLEILELLGQGGMGAVYKARQRGLDRLVALKVLPPGIGYDAAFAERFKREARSLARLNHPNIVAVYDFGQAAGLFYFLMEYVDGVNLRQMERTERPSPKQALGIVMQICEALQFAHDEGIVHRDIKPENILLDKKGRVKIADFGLAKLLARMPADFTLTQPQQVMGTPSYMAPEQIEHPAEVDQRADIYSLGVVFYEMLTGELPLGRFAPPSQKFQVDVRLDEVVLKTLEKEPSRRYQHASEVKTDVEEISRGPQAPAAPALAAQVPDVVPRQRWTGITMAFIMLAQVAFLMLQASASVMKARCFVVLAAMGGASLAWWWYLLAKSPDRPRSFADFFRTMLGPHSRAKRLALPLGIFLGACAVAAIAVSAMDVGDAAITVVIAIPLVIGPYLLMAVLWRIYRPAAGWVRSQAKPVAGTQPAHAARRQWLGPVGWQILLCLVGVGASLAPILPKSEAFWGMSWNYKYSLPQGLVVESVAPGSAAQQAGFLAGDVITAIDGVPFGDGQFLRDLFEAIPPRGQARFAVHRGDRTLDLNGVAGDPQVEAVIYSHWQFYCAAAFALLAIFLVAARPVSAPLWRPIVVASVGLAAGACLMTLAGEGGDAWLAGRLGFTIAWKVPWGTQAEHWYFPRLQAIACLGAAILLVLSAAIEIRNTLLRKRRQLAVSAGGPAVTQESASQAPPPPEQPESAPGGLPAQAEAQRPGKGRRTRPAWLVAGAIVGALVLLLAVPIVGGLVAWRLVQIERAAEPPDATAVLPEPDGREVTVFLWGHGGPEGNNWEMLITKTGVEMDRFNRSGTLPTGDTKDGSLKFVAEGPTVVRLFEHGPTADLYTAGPYDVDNSRLTYQAKLRTWGLEGRAYLEMRCHFPGGEEFVSRGLDKPLSGTNDWTSAETSFVVKGAREPDNVQLNLVIDGKGTVWMDDVGLTLRPPSAKRGG